MRHLVALLLLSALPLTPMMACGDSGTSETSVDEGATEESEGDSSGSSSDAQERSGQDTGSVAADAAPGPGDAGEASSEDTSMNTGDTSTPAEADGAQSADVEEPGPEDVLQSEDVEAPSPDVEPDEVEEPNADWDNDGLTNLHEAYIGSDPNNPDSDGDGLSDSEEFSHGTSVFLSDSDGDGLSDSAEVNAGTNPARSDSDGDGFDDGAEGEGGSDPNDLWSWPFGGEQWPDMSPFSETSYGSGWGAGEVLPELAMIDQFGELIEMARFHGYVVLLDFVAGWCVPCREAAQEAEAKWESLRDQGFLIVHLLVEGNVPGSAVTAGLQNEWRLQYGINFPVTREPEGGQVYTHFTEKSGIYPGLLPFYVLLDREMRIDSGYGPSGANAMEARITELLAQSTPQLSPSPSHATDVEAALICDTDGDGIRHGSCGGEDCDDSDGAIYPGADELCDEVDRNCDGLATLARATPGSPTKTPTETATGARRSP